MRRVSAIAILVVSIAFCIASVYNFASQNALARSVRGSLASVGERGRGLSSEFVAIIPSREDDPYYAAAAKSLAAAALTANAAVRFIEYRPGAPGLSTPSDPAYLGRLIRSCAFLDIKGIILSVPDAPEIVSAVDECDAAGIPVVTLEYDSPASKRKAYVGVNGFYIGHSAGAIASGLRATDVNAILVLPDAASASVGYTESLRLGFMSAVRERPGIVVQEVMTSPSSPIAAENLVRSALARHPKTNVLVLTTLRDTLGAAQALIDLNRVADVSLIGVADSPECRAYVASGVIAAALVRDPELAGRRCVETLLELNRDSNASAFVDTGIRVLTSHGISEDFRSRP